MSSILGWLRRLYWGMCWVSRMAVGLIRTRLSWILNRRLDRILNRRLNRRFYGIVNRGFDRGLDRRPDRILDGRSNRGSNWGLRRSLRWSLNWLRAINLRSRSGSRRSETRATLLHDTIGEGKESKDCKNG
jgi:hypothetical protein